MNILDTYSHKLIFNIDYNAPKKYKEKWNEFKLKCESGNNEYIVERMKHYCRLETNKNLPYLDRVEGGLGGNNNVIHKQIRFRSGSYSSYSKEYTTIMLDQIISTDIEKWTYNELDDLIYAFIKTANYYMNEECVEGYIGMFNNKILNDSESDSE